MANTSPPRKHETPRPIFSTGWFRHHGIGYLDVILAALERSNLGKILGDSSTKRPITLAENDQYELADSIGYFGKRQGLKLERWSAVYYLVPRAELTEDNHRAAELTEPSKWRRVLRSVEESRPDWSDWKDGFDLLREKLEQDKVFPKLDWFQNNWEHGSDAAMRTLWHIINAAPFNTQLAWYKKHSPLFARNKSLIHFLELQTDDIDDPVQVTQAMYQWIKKSATEGPYVVNLWGTATAIQFGWYYLSWNRPRLKNAVFLKCMTPGTKKNDKRKRFVPIEVTVVPADPIGALEQTPKPNSWHSTSRQQAIHWLHFCLKHDDNFSILLLGGRGTGKTSAVRSAWHELHPNATNRPFVSANCSNFSDPVHARSELFGHEKGAFTGATAKRIGLLARARGGMLFLDEVHRLDRITAGMLLTALQTDSSGTFTFTPMGARKPAHSKFQPVFASNWSLDQLREHLGEDFVDRISQRIISIPSLDPSEVADAWSDVWNEMKFPNTVHNPIDETEFRNYLLSLHPFPGSFRDLQHLAILVADYQRYAMENEGRAPRSQEKTGLVAWLKQEMELRRSTASQSAIVVPFDITDTRLTEKSFLTECRHRYARAVVEKYGTAAEAARVLRERHGSKINATQLSRWINRKGSVK